MMTNSKHTLSPRGTAFITGASSGIGAAFARRLAADGYTLLLHGRREDQLAALCSELRTRCAVDAQYVLGELSRQEDLSALARRLAEVPDLVFLINNAGSSTIRNFHQEEVDGQENMVRVHAIAAIRFAHIALRVMLARGSGSIINVSSVASFMVAPGSATYCAVKAFLTSFSESLALEVRGTGVRVQALCPGFTMSDFHQRIGYEVNEEFTRGFMRAEEVVDASLRDLDRGKVICVPGVRYKAVTAVRRFVPRGILYWASLKFNDRRMRKFERFNGRG